MKRVEYLSAGRNKQAIFQGLGEPEWQLYCSMSIMDCGHKEGSNPLYS